MGSIITPLTSWNPMVHSSGRVQHTGWTHAIIKLPLGDKSPGCNIPPLFGHIEKISAGKRRPALHRSLKFGATWWTTWWTDDMVDNMVDDMVDNMVDDMVGNMVAPAL
jgi:hypothetical protein